MEPDFFIKSACASCILAVLLVAIVMYFEFLVFFHHMSHISFQSFLYFKISEHCMAKTFGLGEVTGLEHSIC